MTQIFAPCSNWHRAIFYRHSHPPITMKLRSVLLLASLLPAAAFSFSPLQISKSSSSTTSSTNAVRNDDNDVMEFVADGIVSRKDFVRNSAAALILSSSAAAAISGNPGIAVARGRATFESSYLRYSPRIIAGGEFYKNDLRKMIESNDWEGIKEATSDPPPKSKAEKRSTASLKRGPGGGFSQARVINACDLFAGAFSDSSISTKTKKMQEQSEILGEVVKEMNLTAKQALGEDTGGGIFSAFAKKPTKQELAAKVRDLYAKGGNAYNQYVFQANDELALQFDRLPFL